MIRGPTFLDTEFARRVRSDFDGNLDDLRILKGSGDLMSADRQTGEAGPDLVDPLGVPDLDEMAGGVRILDSAGPDSEPVGTRGNVFRIGQNVDALNAPGEFHIGSPVTEGKFGVMFQIGVLSLIAG